VGFTVVVPLVPDGAMKLGSLLLQVQPLLPLVFHVRVAPVPPCTTDGAERMTVGGTVTFSAAETVTAGVLHARVYVYEPADAGVTETEPAPVLLPVNAAVGGLLLAIHPWAPLVFHASVVAVPCSAAAGVTLRVGGG
jgi:hypothetical protein